MRNPVQTPLQTTYKTGPYFRFNSAEYVPRLGPIGDSLDKRILLKIWLPALQADPPHHKVRKLRQGHRYLPRLGASAGRTTNEQGCRVSKCLSVGVEVAYIVIQLLGLDPMVANYLLPQVGFQEFFNPGQRYGLLIL